MASLIKRRDTYYVTWREPDGAQRRKSLKTSSQTEARKRLEAWIRKQGQENDLPPQTVPPFMLDPRPTSYLQKPLVPDSQTTRIPAPGEHSPARCVA